MTRPKKAAPPSAPAQSSPTIDGAALAKIVLHYYGTGPAAKMAQGVRAAVDVLAKTPSTRQ